MVLCPSLSHEGAPAARSEDDLLLTYHVLQDDASLTRSNPYLLKLFAEAQLQVALNIQQRNFPKEIFKVRMYVLRPKGP